MLRSAATVKVPMSDDSIRERLIGTWKLLSATREDVASGAKTDFLGADPMGFISYSPDGRMIVLNVGGGRPKPKGAQPTAVEAETLFRSMTSYAGSYTIDGNVLTHHVEISWNETWTGSEQKRVARFEGNRAFLSTLPSIDPITGTMTVRTMEWEKVG
jgi:Lipocalin-like domain